MLLLFNIMAPRCVLLCERCVFIRRRASVVIIVLLCKVLYIACHVVCLVPILFGVLTKPRLMLQFLAYFLFLCFGHAT